MFEKDMREDLHHVGIKAACRHSGGDAIAAHYLFMAHH